MSSHPFEVSISPIDQERFGVITALASNLTLEKFDETLRFCDNNQVEFLIARCHTDQIETVHLMEANNFKLMDTLIYYKKNLAKVLKFPEIKKYKIRTVQSGEEHEVKEIALEAFQDYLGHYHTDPRLNVIDSQSVYPDWAYQACLTRGPQKEVLVCPVDGVLAGFVIIGVDEEGFSIVNLSGLRKRYQNTGIYAAFYFPLVKWSLDQGIKYSMASTQITNTAQQNYFARFGYKPIYSVYTYHKWFD